ncbi:MAG: tRNA-dihydrouridine synthase B [marine bacterium B5-7]|nr:MAG: tRNA-dihydrouridine synthase B [marine bacterium B5-7]
MKIGEFEFSAPVFLAPMCGITDTPFRKLCKRLGAPHALTEMIGSQPGVRQSRKARDRMDHRGDSGPIHVQIAGANPSQMADAARYNVDHGADLIDINMGCPAKKVCNTLAGSSLLRNVKQVSAIIEAVIEAVDVPVTLKMRTGWDRDSRNCVEVGRIAESAGIACITLHGRTRNDFYKGEAEFESLKRLRDAVQIPLIANGDIVDARRARTVLRDTGADAVMIGRGAQSHPWLPGDVASFLSQGSDRAEPSDNEKRDILLALVADLHAFYGDLGVRMARKHISWQIECFSPEADERRAILKAPCAQRQLELLQRFFESRIQLPKVA